MVTCKICGNIYKNNNSLSKHVSRTHKMTTKKYYDTYILNGAIPVCEICMKQVFKYNNLEKGYSLCCCHKCRAEKGKRTNLKRYGVENVFQLKEVKEKSKQTNIKNLGVAYPSQSLKIREKIKQTNLNKYGVDCNLKLETTKNQIKQTCLKKYGVEYIGQAEEIKEKSKQTNLKKYGTEYALSSKKVQNKRKETNLKKYGTENAASSSVVKEKIKKIRKDKFTKLLTTGARLEHCSMTTGTEDYTNSTLRNVYQFKCNYCNRIFTSNICNGHQPKCSRCFPKQISKLEQKVVDMLSDHVIDFQQNIRHIIPPYELDIYISSKNLAIETHGLYWHSEQQLLHKRGNYLPKNYHLLKYQFCFEKGIQLLQFFEDEINYKYNVVKAVILNKLQKSTSLCGARQCSLEYVDNKVANIFLDNNHLHGKNYGQKINIGAFFAGNLVGLMSFKHGNISRKVTEWELDRFCCLITYNIPGLASKCFKKFIKDNSNIKKIITYADLRFASGAVYNYLGFVLVKRTVPNYYYVVGGVRKHRFSYMKSKLKEKLDIFDPQLTEYENMLNNGYDKVYDCGHLKYEFNIS